MHRLIQPALILVLATLLAIGPGWCRMHCAAANDFGDAPIASCCHAASSTTSQQHSVPAGTDCRCQIQPVTNEVRGSVVDQPAPVLIGDFFPLDASIQRPIRMAGVPVRAGKASVPIHVLKCVWRC